MSQATTTMSGQVPTPSCNPSLRVCPTCKQGQVCRLSVIESSSQCPIASCVVPGFDTGTDNNTAKPSASNSVIAPVLGALAALCVIAIIAFFIIRRRRQHKRRMLGQVDSIDSFPKQWHSSGHDSMGHKDVIRIAYIPSMIGESPIGAPEPSQQTGGVLKPNFTQLRNEDQGNNKHDSVASLDEAVVMAVTTKATPQVMKLNTIKTSQSDLIQRSNSLHSSNSVKRSQSQRRIADKKLGGASGATSSSKKPSPLGNSQSDSESEHDDNNSSVSKPMTISQNSDDNPFMTEAELSAIMDMSYSNNTQSSNTSNNNNNNSNNNNSSSSSSSGGGGISSSNSASGNDRSDLNAKVNSRSNARLATRTSNPFLSIAESTLVGSSTGPNTPMSPAFTSYSTVPNTPMTETTAFTSMPISLSERLDDDPLAGLPTPNLRPWANSNPGSTALRDSTFSTLSDARSSTRGDGEEIMIFWDGQRDSKAMP